MASQTERVVMDRIDTAALTSEKRYGIYRLGLVAAAILIFILTAAGVSLIFGIRDVLTLLCIYLPLVFLCAIAAQLFLWWQHKKAAQRREMAANAWVSATFARQQQQTQDADPSWFARNKSLRGSTRSTPPPGYHTVDDD